MDVDETLEALGAQANATSQALIVEPMQVDNVEPDVAVKLEDITSVIFLFLIFNFLLISLIN